MRPQAIQARKANQNGDAEQSHHRFKTAVDQALLLRGSRDFDDRAVYERFLREVFARRNGGRAERFAEERPRLRGLPARRMDTWHRRRVRVTQGSTIRIGSNIYSVPSRLIGEQVDVHVMAEYLEVWHGAALVERVARQRGRNKCMINYRHVIDWLVRKPGAFAAYRHREAMFSEQPIPPGLRRPAGAVPGPRRQGLPADPRAGGEGVRGGGRRGPGPAPGVGRTDHPDRRRGAPAARPGVAAGDGRRHHPGGFVDLRPLTRERGGPAITQPSDVRESLTDCLRDLHLPTMRRDYESAAARARQESSSYERYLLDLAERECEARRANRVERLLQESRLLMEKSLATLDLKRLPAKAVQQVRSLLEGDFVDRHENVLIFGNPGFGEDPCGLRDRPGTDPVGAEGGVRDVRPDGPGPADREAGPEAPRIPQADFPISRC